MMPISKLSIDNTIKSKTSTAVLDEDKKHALQDEDNY